MEEQQGPASARRRVGRTALVAGVAVAAGAGALGLAGIASAADPADPAADTGGGTGSVSAAPEPAGHGRGRHLDHGALHGQFVVEQEDGVYRTVDVQRGEVAEVSSTSITVVSEDGFRKMYAVTPETLVNSERDGIASVAVGEAVRVQALVEGDTSTATRISDMSARDGGRGRGPR